MALVYYFISIISYAGCSDISDLDERAKCYENKIEDKQEDYESTGKKLDDIRNKKNSVSSQISQLASQLTITQSEISQIQQSIDEVKNELNIIDQNLTDRKTKLEEKIKLRNFIIRNYSKKTILNELELLFGGKGMGLPGFNGFEYSSITQVLNKSATQEAIKLIALLNSEISTFEQNKADATSLKNELETEQTRLISIKNDLDSKKNLAQGELTELDKEENNYESELAELQQEINELSQKQQEILNLKSGDESGTVGDYDTPSSKTPNPPFEPAFAAFSYGAYTHYNGMSQYGAKGRAEDGQDYKDILEHYYRVDTYEKDDFPDEISVQGYGDLDFQYYLYGIAEMPSDWPKEALKAQAIAARTFAYRTGKPICTTQACQVFSKSKADNPPSRWKDAVDDTKDEILDDPQTSQYSSTTGGYLNQSGWDTESGGNWPSDAYEKIAGSPWFYKAWYTKSYNSNDNCGRAHPWMTEDEMADILNAVVVWQNGNSSDRDHISPITTSCWGGDPYSHNEMADKADDYGTKYDKVTGVDVEISNGGYTSKVFLETDQGRVTVSGDIFKTVYNLRAPSYISIKSRLYDLEKRD